MYPADEDEILSRRFTLGVKCEVDSVVDRRQVIEAGGAIGIADGNEISVTVFS